MSITYKFKHSKTLQEVHDEIDTFLKQTRKDLFPNGINHRSASVLQAELDFVLKENETKNERIQLLEDLLEQHEIPIPTANIKQLSTKNHQNETNTTRKRQRQIKSDSILHETDQSNHDIQFDNDTTFTLKREIARLTTAYQEAQMLHANELDRKQTEKEELERSITNLQRKLENAINEETDTRTLLRQKEQQWLKQKHQFESRILQLETNIQDLQLKSSSVTESGASSKTIRTLQGQIETLETSLNNAKSTYQTVIEKMQLQLNESTEKVAETSKLEAALHRINLQNQFLKEELAKYEEAAHEIQVATDLSMQTGQETKSTEKNVRKQNETLSTKKDDDDNGTLVTQQEYSSLFAPTMTNPLRMFGLSSGIVQTSSMPSAASSTSQTSSMTALASSTSQTSSMTSLASSTSQASSMTTLASSTQQTSAMTTLANSTQQASSTATFEFATPTVLEHSSSHTSDLETQQDTSMTNDKFVFSPPFTMKVVGRTLHETDVDASSTIDTSTRLRENAPEMQDSFMKHDTNIIDDQRFDISSLATSSNNVSMHETGTSSMYESVVSKSRHMTAAGARLGMLERECAQLRHQIEVARRNERRMKLELEKAQSSKRDMILLNDQLDAERRKAQRAEQAIREATSLRLKMENMYEEYHQLEHIFTAILGEVEVLDEPSFDITSSDSSSKTDVDMNDASMSTKHTTTLMSTSAASLMSTNASSSMSTSAASSMSTSAASSMSKNMTSMSDTTQKLVTERGFTLGKRVVDALQRVQTLHRSSVHAQGTAEAGLSACQRQLVALRTQLSTLEKELSESEQTRLTEETARITLDRRVALLTRERDSLKRLLQTYDAEDRARFSTPRRYSSKSRITSPEVSSSAGTAAAQSSATGTATAQASPTATTANETSTETENARLQRIEYLETELKQAQERIKELEQNVAQGTPATVLSKARERATKLREELDEAQKNVDRLTSQLTKAEIENERLRGQIGSGAVYDPTRTKIVHFKQNPAAQTTQSKREALEKEIDELRAQNASLQAQITDLESVSRSSSPTVRMDQSTVGSTAATSNTVTSATSTSTTSSKTNVTTNVMANSRDIESLKKRNERLKELFQNKIRQFREAVYLLTGYKVDMNITTAGPTQLRLRSVYAEREDDDLQFKMTNGSLEMLETPFCARIDSKITAYLTTCQSIPAFLANLTLDLFERTTFVGT